MPIRPEESLQSRAWGLSVINRHVRSFLFCLGLRMLVRRCCNYSNLKLDIYDSNNQSIRTAGVSGKLVVTGEDYLASSYINGDSITATYDTGDLAEWTSLNPASFRLHGRRDRMVKIRGHRVELDGVQHQLLEIPGVNSALTWVHSGRIEALVCPSDLDTKIILDELKNRLPDYMVPSLILTRDFIPLNLNGKIN
ncbi:MAG: acyl-coenzyme A synthetase/AMP-(fatty) acid ligase [Parasphingorhabdus sp.]|jgi:acyl-coenzyme A synthetase/AMP-(fatty) acid ligase